MNKVNIGPCNDLIWLQAITESNVNFLSVGSLGVNFSEIRLKIWHFFLNENALENVFELLWKCLQNGIHIVLTFTYITLNVGGRS